MRQFIMCFAFCIGIASASPQIREKLLADTLLNTAAAARTVDTLPDDNFDTPESLAIIDSLPVIELPAVSKPYAPSDDTTLTVKPTPHKEYHAKNMICDLHHTDGIGSKIRCYELDINQLQFDINECTPAQHGGIVCEKQLFPV